MTSRVKVADCLRTQTRLSQPGLPVPRKISRSCSAYRDTQGKRLREKGLLALTAAYWRDFLLSTINTQPSTFSAGNEWAIAVLSGAAGELSRGSANGATSYQPGLRPAI